MTCYHYSVDVPIMSIGYCTSILDYEEVIELDDKMMSIHHQRTRSIDH